MRPKIKAIPVEKLLPSQNQLRGFSLKQIETLTKSIQEKGIIYPILVTPFLEFFLWRWIFGQQKYIIIDGHARIEVAKRLNMKKVFCLIISDEPFTKDQLNKLINK